MQANIPVESELQRSLLSITTFPVIFCSLEQIIMPSKHEATDMIALYIQQSLVIHCLFIDDITASLAE